MKNVSLVGFMGSGKSTIGSILAKKLGYSFIDVDKRIEEKTGRSIPDIFESDGEETFRQIETASLKEALNRKNAVVACGGGAILREENREALKQGSVVVYLKAGPGEIYKRVGGTGDKRPLLNVSNPKAEINRLVEEREPYYRAVADVTVETTGKTANEVVESVLKELRAKGLKGQ